MHEASITESIITSVIDTITTEGLDGTVTSVHITVGVTQGLVPESMQFFFDMEKPGTPLDKADLIVDVQGMIALCPVCNTEHELDIPIMYCPDCGAVMSLIKGDEIIINEIEVSDHEKDSSEQGSP
jgi:hydrogenase nickel insertion protein HypA